MIRFCTDEQNLVKFYDELGEKCDCEDSIDVDILDDFMNEAHQVHKHNKWLDYALPLHLCREMEFHEQTFDTLDGRTLTRGELIEFLSVLFGEENLA